MKQSRSVGRLPAKDVSKVGRERLLLQPLQLLSPLLPDRRPLTPPRRPLRHLPPRYQENHSLLATGLCLLVTMAGNMIGLLPSHHSNHRLFRHRKPHLLHQSHSHLHRSI